MFESLALENPKNSRRRWTTVASFILEGLAVGVLILAPLGYTEVIALKIDKPLEVPPGRPVPIETRMRPHNSADQRPTTELAGERLILPTRIPPTIAHLNDAHNQVAPDIGGPYVIGSTGPLTDSPINRLIASNHNPAVAGPSVAGPRITRVSRLDPGMLIKQVQPIYPKIAQTTRIEGTVLLAAVIDTQGRITQLHTLSGHPLLIPAAISAVQQWRYRPYILNGQAVEVETQISVVFSLQH
jgi:protein TonB